MASGKILGIENLNPFMRFQRNSWGTSLTFTLPVGMTALVIVNSNQIIIVWNNDGGVVARALTIPTYASGDPVKPVDPSTYSVSRDASDTTKVTYTRTGNATIEAIIPTVTN